MCKKNCQRFGHIRAAILRLSCLNWTAWQVPQTTQMSFGDRRETYTIAHKKGRPLRVFLFYSSPCRTGRLFKIIAGLPKRQQQIDKMSHNKRSDLPLWVVNCCYAYQHARAGQKRPRRLGRGQSDREEGRPQQEGHLAVNDCTVTLIS